MSNETPTDEEIEAACKANLNPLAEPSDTERKYMRTALTAAARVSNETKGWRPIDSAPKDGTPFLATLRIFNAQTKEFMHHDTQVVWVDDETGELHPDCYFGWDLADCEFWMPIPPLPTREPEGR